MSTPGATTVRADLRLAHALVRGSDRREWWRLLLTGTGAALVAGCALAALAVAGPRGQVSVPFAHGLLDRPGERRGVVAALLLLLVPVLVLLGQCARIGAVHRDRRLAALRLAGAPARRVRRIAGLETGLACAAGSTAATVFCVLLLLRVWQRPPALMWAGAALVAVAVPVLGALVAVLALRRVIASPLGVVRRSRPRTGRGPALVCAGAASVLSLAALGLVTAGARHGAVWTALLVCAVVTSAGAGAVGLSGVTARLVGRRLAGRTGRPAVLIAAGRLRQDPWAAARAHGAVLLVTVVGTGFVGVRRVLLDGLSEGDTGRGAGNASFYTAGLNLTAAALSAALVVALMGLAVHIAEPPATRRGAAAAQVAAGVPRGVLVRALLLETALPLAPGVALAGAGGLALGGGYAALAGGGGLPWESLAVPVLVWGACVAAAATAVPGLKRGVRPGELRHE
ncbi:ABC transporter permease [Streptomyces sp. B3I8]|uniref:ABC transporter permease n=1 Tax=Streptomyces sp. B3I8 TaxID=3042303 RepID=UPI002789B275|nr:ABC transporter permease [Streptomyces sp. B3I8]MDQ0787022.1 hypothetical protein [Streptomyces sp. B3I8]